MSKIWMGTDFRIVATVGRKFFCIRLTKFFRQFVFQDNYVKVSRQHDGSGARIGNPKIKEVVKGQQSTWRPRVLGLRWEVDSF